jgi:hypothetical protein
MHRFLHSLVIPGENDKAKNVSWSFGSVNQRSGSTLAVSTGVFLFLASDGTDLCPEQSHSW